MTFAKWDVLDLFIWFIHVFKSAKENLLCFKGGFLYMRSETEQNTDMWSHLLAGARLNGQIHAQMCQNAVIIHVNPLCNINSWEWKYMCNSELDSGLYSCCRLCLILIKDRQNQSLTALNWRTFVALIRNKGSFILLVKTAVLFYIRLVFDSFL